MDILGINVYAGADAIAGRVRAEGWTKPYCVTEFGLAGPWEAEHTAWRAPIEPSSREKAAVTYAFQMTIMEDTQRCLGSYVFLWGQKQEATASWFGMFLPTGEKTSRVDAISRAWTGRWPANRAPELDEVEVPFRTAELPPGRSVVAIARYRDPEGDPLSYQWEVREESSDRRQGGDAERKPAAVPGAIVAADAEGRVEIRTPAAPGGYRLFVTVTDGKGSGAVDNWPFRVVP